MKLIPAKDAEPSDLPYIVKPFFAVSEVEQKLSNPAFNSLVNHDHGPVRLSNGHSGRPEYKESDVLKDVREGRIVLVDRLGGYPAFPMFEYKDGQWRSTEDFRTDFFLRSALEYLNRQELTPDDIKMGAAQGGATFAGITSTAVNDDVAVDTTNATPDRKPSLPLGESAKVAPLATAPAAQTAANNEPDKIEPGFHVVRHPISKVELLTKLYGAAGNKPDSFDRLNPGLDDQVLPGEMIVLGAPDGQECTQEEADLMSVADSVNRQVRSLDEDDAQFIVDYYDLLEMLTANTSAGLGAGAAMISRQIEQINRTLHDLESLHQKSFRENGHLNSSEFFEERRKLFKRLDFALGDVARRGLSLDDAPKLKQALGVSTKSLVHNWKQAGVGEIPGYATHYERLATGAKYMRYTGYLAIGLDASVSAMKIKEACTTGNDEECERVSYKESGRFIGATTGGAMGGTAALGCGFFALTTGGVGGVACVIIVGGLGSSVGGSLGSQGGELVGERIYKAQVDE